MPRNKPAEKLDWQQPLEDVSTPGHGQGEGPVGYKFCEAGRRRQWEGPE